MAETSAVPPSVGKRERFLQRIVEDIELGRIHRTLQRHCQVSHVWDSPPPSSRRKSRAEHDTHHQRRGSQSVSHDNHYGVSLPRRSEYDGNHHRRGSQGLRHDNGSLVKSEVYQKNPSSPTGRRKSSCRGSPSPAPTGVPQSPLPSKLPPTGLERKKSDEVLLFPKREERRQSKDRNLPHISFVAAREERPLFGPDDYRRLPLLPFNSSGSHSSPFKSSGPFYGYKSGGGRPPSPYQGREPFNRANMFSWKICTPTNYKRAKSYHEILLERKWLRRNGRMPSKSQFFSVFKLRDSKKLTAGDRIRKLLRRAQFYGDDIKRLPLVRFRRAVRTLIALLKTVKLSQDKGKGSEPSAWLDEDDIRASRRAYEMFGITFDAYLYRAQREFQVSNEAKAILTMAPGTRSDEQKHVALLSLSQAVPEFGEFPKAMQEALVSVGWYETFEARRIIIREGHMADNFYLILSGSAVVTIREQNGAGDYFGRTAAVLQKGNSFGELALIYGGKRTATVTCKDNVELLAVGRDDYIDIFMHKSKDGGEPEHIKFLKQIKVFCGWPIDELPLDDPSVFLYTFVRRGMVLCKDSNKSEWIYIIKSGSCRVLTALNAVKPSIQGSDNRWDHIVLVSGAGEEHHNVFAIPQSRRSDRLSPIRTASSEGRSHSHKLGRAYRLPSIQSKTDHEVQEAAERHLQELDEILRKRNEQPTLVTEIANGNGNEAKQRPRNERIFVNLLTLQAKDVYGLESVVLSVFKQPTNTSLVSDGAECIMINKKFFQQKLTEDVAKRMRTEIRPLPSEEVLQEKLQTKTDWDTYRAITVADFVEFRKHVHDFLDV